MTKDEILKMLPPYFLLEEVKDDDLYCIQMEDEDGNKVDMKGKYGDSLTGMLRIEYLARNSDENENREYGSEFQSDDTPLEFIHMMIDELKERVLLGQAKVTRN